ncbi:MAG: hypothetical protein BWY28_01765 [bacterium ADurb.Bin236]|nr:MAG: hypothetical protein BWY28_01765 [bacterium ADurb.Bin236]HOY63475.1 hypothetical protein [bacterium]
MGYREDRGWSDRYIPKIKEIVAPYLIVEAPEKVDQKMASDLIIMEGRDKMLACRVRRPGYAEKYPYQFTLRLRRDSGAETEYAKIASGWADWMFYGHAVPGDVTEIKPWFLIDLNNFRHQLIIEDTRSMARRETGVSFGYESNRDGTHFIWYDLRYFAPDPGILIASSLDVPIIPKPNKRESIS